VLGYDCSLSSGPSITRSRTLVFASVGCAALTLATESVVPTDFPHRMLRRDNRCGRRT
jgi:hypothetical protein